MYIPKCEYMLGVETPTIDGRCNEEIVRASGKMVSADV